MRTDDAQFVAQVIEVAGRAREHGNPPYGALLVDGEGRVLLEEENTTVTANDITAHPELKVAMLAAQRWTPHSWPAAQCMPAPSLARCVRQDSTAPALAGSYLPRVAQQDVRCAAIHQLR